MADDDQLNEDTLAAHAIMLWMSSQNSDAVTITHQQKFHLRGLKPIAVKMAVALDQQVARHGLDSMNHSETWNKIAVNLLALYHLGDSSWMLGTDLWGPAKGLVRDLMLKAVRNIRQVGYFEFDGETITIPKHNLGKRKQDDHSETNSPARHHRSHAYKLHGREPRLTSPSHRLQHPEEDIADAQAVHQAQQQDAPEAENLDDVDNGKFLEGGVSKSQPVGDQTVQTEVQQPGGGPRHKRRKQLSVTKAKNSKTSTAATPQTVPAHQKTRLILRATTPMISRSKTFKQWI